MSVDCKSKNQIVTGFPRSTRTKSCAKITLESTSRSIIYHQGHTFSTRRAVSFSLMGRSISAIPQTRRRLRSRSLSKKANGKIGLDGSEGERERRRRRSLKVTGAGGAPVFALYTLVGFKRGLTPPGTCSLQGRFIVYFVHTVGTGLKKAVYSIRIIQLLEKEPNNLNCPVYGSHIKNVAYKTILSTKKGVLHPVSTVLRDNYKFQSLTF